MEITKEHKQVTLIEIDVDRKYHTRRGLHFNKLGKFLLTNKITQTIYSILGNKQKQSTVMSEKYEIQVDESEVDGRNSNEGNKGIRNNEDIIKLTQNGVDKNSKERFNQDEDETTSDISDDKNDEEKFSLINNKVILSQELEFDGENKGVNKNKTVIFAQDITDNTQSDSVDKILETPGTSARNKKSPSSRSNDFLW
jgi:hypothetical protein